MIEILIPVLDRPDKVEPLARNIAEVTDVPHHVLFLCSNGDRDEIAAVEGIGADYLTLKAPPAKGQYAKKINLGYRETESEWLALCADDVVFHPGWATVALATAGDKFNVVALNDKANSFVRAGLLATHALVRRSYVDDPGCSLDGPGVIYHEGYSHNFCDCELSVLARHRGVFAYAPGAILRHVHPIFSQTAIDRTYEFGRRDFDKDRSLFVSRMTPDHLRDRMVRRFTQRRAHYRTALAQALEAQVISVVIATYESQRWAEIALERAYPSAVDQTDEVIVEHQEHGTVASARNAGAAAATGDWLVFLDADDELAPGYIEAMESAAQPNTLLAPIVQKVIRGRRRIPRYYREDDLLLSNWLVVGTGLEHSLFERADGFGDYEHGFEDWALWFKCTKLGAEVVKVPEAIYRAHFNPGSMMHQLWRNPTLQEEMHYRVKAELDAWKEKT